MRSRLSVKSRFIANCLAVVLLFCLLLKTSAGNIANILDEGSAINTSLENTSEKKVLTDVISTPKKIEPASAKTAPMEGSLFSMREVDDIQNSISKTEPKEVNSKKLDNKNEKKTEVVAEKLVTNDDVIDKKHDRLNNENITDLALDNTVATVPQPSAENAPKVIESGNTVSLAEQSENAEEKTIKSKNFVTTENKVEEPENKNIIAIPDTKNLVVSPSVVVPAASKENDTIKESTDKSGVIVKSIPEQPNDKEVAATELEQVESGSKVIENIPSSPFEVVGEGVYWCNKDYFNEDGLLSLPEVTKVVLITEEERIKKAKAANQEDNLTYFTTTSDNLDAEQATAFAYLVVNKVIKPVLIISEVGKEAEVFYKAVYLLVTRQVDNDTIWKEVSANSILAEKELEDLKSKILSLNRDELKKMSDIK